MFQNVSKKMPSTSRPRVTGGSGGIGRLTANTPMSERQQMALLMQMTSANNQAGSYLFHSYHVSIENLFYKMGQIMVYIHTNTHQLNMTLYCSLLYMIMIMMLMLYRHESSQ